MVRSVPANAADSIYCSLLAQNAVHGAMAGFTQFTVGLCNNRLVYLPIPLVNTLSSLPQVISPYVLAWAPKKSACFLDPIISFILFHAFVLLYRWSRRAPA